MPGKLCNGATSATAGELKNSKAFCEGMGYRAAGTTIGAPKADNPHVAGSEAADAWDAGWDVAEAAKGGTIGKPDAGCCADFGNTVSV